jgi:hypothetical protein
MGKKRLRPDPEDRAGRAGVDRVVGCHVDHVDRIGRAVERGRSSPRPDPTRPEQVAGMADRVQGEIDAALGPASDPTVEVAVEGAGELRSCFRVSDLAVASVAAATRELASLTGARDVALIQRLALTWFGMTPRPAGGVLPSAWDPIAGDYEAADGWMGLHTNAPRHRDAEAEGRAQGVAPVPEPSPPSRRTTSSVGRAPALPRGGHRPLAETCAWS